ncbi:MAG: hypothetical protein Q8T08_17300, partial [Ignavibacteria bacterium]|nr:hypothetical protein [Ignavibacteria bacterium]
NFTGPVLSVIQILLALFKLSFNSYAAPALQQHANKILSIRESDSQLYSITITKLLLALLNVIVIPCLVVMVISPDCFYDLLTGPDAVTSSFTYLGLCDTPLVITQDGGHSSPMCVTRSLQQDQTTYTPPFAYSFQCSSSFITYYAPTFVIMCIISAFLVPAQRLLLLWLRRHLSPSSRMFGLLNSFTPRKLKELPSPETLAKSRTNPWKHPVFIANQLVISLLTYLALLLTFGALFPPLAVCCAVAMTSLVLTARLEVGRYVTAAVAAGRQDCLDEIERVCTNVAPRKLLQVALAIVLSLSCMFYTMFLFDTLGNAVGFVEAYWVLIVVPALPLAVLALFLAVYALLGGQLIEVTLPPGVVAAS